MFLKLLTESTRNGQPIRLNGIIFWEAAFEEFEVDELVFSENTFWFTFCQARQLMLMISKYCRKAMIDQLGDDLNNFFENL